MELTFLGRGAAFNVLEGNTSACFIEDEKLFLIDCGETVFLELAKRDILSKIKEIYVVISHTHSDHCGSLGSLALYCEHMYGTRLKLIVPHNDEYVSQLNTLMKQGGNTDKTYEVLYDDELDYVFKTFDKVRYERTLHLDILICHSFVFETNVGAYFYSGDTRTLNNLNHFIETHDHIQQIYMEVTDSTEVGDVHMNIDVFDQAISKEIKEKVIMMHFRSEECKNKALEYGYKIIEC